VVSPRGSKPRSARRHGAITSAALSACALVCLLQLAPSAGARAAAVIPVSIVNDGRIVVRPSQVKAEDGDTIRICNRSNVIASLFSGSNHNKLGGGYGGRAGSGLKVKQGECTNVTVHNPTDASLRVYIGSEIQSNLKLIVNVAPCSTAPSKRTTQAASKCAKKPATPAGTFVLASTKVTNVNPKELKINAAGGTATLDHCCDGGAWKVVYGWKVPSTLTAGKSSSLSMSLKVLSIEPNQPIALQMTAIAPDFRQDLPVTYPNPASASKTYAMPLLASQAVSKEVVVYVGWENAEIKYTYRRSG